MRLGEQAEVAPSMPVQVQLQAQVVPAADSEVLLEALEALAATGFGLAVAAEAVPFWVLAVLAALVAAAAAVAPVLGVGQQVLQVLRDNTVAPVVKDVAVLVQAAAGVPVWEEVCLTVEAMQP